MVSKLVEFDDGVKIQVQEIERETGVMGMGSVRGKERGGTYQSEHRLDQIRDMVYRSCMPFGTAWRDLCNLDNGPDSATLEFAIGFDGKGEAFVTDGKSPANFAIKVQWGSNSK